MLLHPGWGRRGLPLLSQELRLPPVACRSECHSAGVSIVRMILSLALLICLLAPGARAQATADQLNKLSLEALTAPPARGSGGGGYAPARRSYVPRSYASRSYAHARPAWHARRSYAAARPSHHWARTRASHRSYATHWSRAPQRRFVAHCTPSVRCPAGPPRQSLHTEILPALTLT
jgi:hypothetical protein